MKVAQSNIWQNGQCGGCLPSATFSGCCYLCVSILAGVTFGNCRFWQLSLLSVNVCHYYCIALFVPSKSISGNNVNNYIFYRRAYKKQQYFGNIRLFSCVPENCIIHGKKNHFFIVFKFFLYVVLGRGNAKKDIQFQTLEAPFFSWWRRAMGTIFLDVVLNRGTKSCYPFKNHSQNIRNSRNLESMRCMFAAKDVLVCMIELFSCRKEVT